MTDRLKRSAGSLSFSMAAVGNRPKLGDTQARIASRAGARMHRETPIASPPIYDASYVDPQQNKAAIARSAPVR